MAGQISLKAKILYFWNKTNGAVHFWISLSTKIEKLFNTRKFLYIEKQYIIIEFDGLTFLIHFIWLVKVCLYRTRPRLGGVREGMV